MSWGMKKKKKKKPLFKSIISNSLGKEFGNFIQGDDVNEKDEEMVLKQKKELSDFVRKVFGRSVLNDYLIVSELGEGGFGSVVLVRCKKTSVEYARKTVSLDKNALQLKSVLSELHSLNASNCDNIIQLHDCVIEENVCYIFLEYCNCGSLADIQRVISAKLPENVIGNLSVGILKGFIYLHQERKIIHRDIKPGNILFHFQGGKGKVVLADFGLAGYKGGKRKFSTFQGSKTYMSPERLSGEEHSFDSDIYSFGIVCLDLALGKFPFKLKASEDQFWQMKQKTTKPNIEKRIDEIFTVNDFSKEFEEMVRNSLHFKPQDRLSAQEILNLDFMIDRSASKFFEWLKKTYIPKFEGEKKKKKSETKME